MTFLAVVLDSVGSADEGFVEQLIERLTEKISCLFPPVLARLFVVVSKTSSSPPPTSFVSFVSRVIPYCGTKTVALGCLHRV
jgi:hypothetical protein